MSFILQIVQAAKLFKKYNKSVTSAYRSSEPCVIC